MTEEFVIEKNVPVPDESETWIGKLDKLDVGDSFLFPEEKRNSVRQNISGHFHVETTKEFKTSKKNQPAGKVRVWRVK